MSEQQPEVDPDEADAFAAQLAQETDEKFQSNKEDQHALLEAAAEEDGAPLLETQCEIYGEVVPVSGRLTGDLIDRVTQLDNTAKAVADGDKDAGELQTVIEELTSICADLIDDAELTQTELYKLYRAEGVTPLRTITENVMTALQQEDERVSGAADGFRSK